MIGNLTEVDLFASIALSQRAATEPWAPVTDYSEAKRRPYEEPQVDLVIGAMQPETVFDAGCGSGLLVKVFHERGVKSYGCDLVNRWPDILDARCFRTDIAAKTLMLPGQWARQYDCVICREVLEHLTLQQIRRAITNLCALSRRFVYITTRYSSEHDLLRVETSDSLDPTHITLASKDFYRMLLALEGFERRTAIEMTMDWLGKGRVLVYERVA